MLSHSSKSVSKCYQQGIVSRATILRRRKRGKNLRAPKGKEARHKANSIVGGQAAASGGRATEKNGVLGEKKATHDPLPPSNTGAAKNQVTTLRKSRKGGLRLNQSRSQSFIELGSVGDL